MSKRIDEIMRISDMGYINEYDDISTVLEHFLNYTIEELNNALPKDQKIYEYAENVAQRLGNIEITDSSQIEHLRMSDLLNIMKYFEDTFSDSDGVLLSYMKNLLNAVVCLKSLLWATLFMSISVKSLMDFFDKESGTSKYSAFYRGMCDMAKECAQFKMSKSTTVKHLFDSICPALYLSWNPGYDKDLYFDTIETACMIIKCIFINGIASWCYDKSKFLDFLEKYDADHNIQNNK